MSRPVMNHSRPRLDTLEKRMTARSREIHIFGKNGPLLATRNFAFDVAGEQITNPFYPIKFVSVRGQSAASQRRYAYNGLMTG